jgi:hypothetical protein
MWYGHEADHLLSINYLHAMHKDKSTFSLLPVSLKSSKYGSEST